MTEPFPEQDKIMAMDQFLAEYFGNNVKTAAAQTTETDPAEAEKIAQMELFEKIAAENGLDLEKLSEDQIAFLWDRTFTKEAGETDAGEVPADEAGEKEKESEGDPAEEKKEEAKKEHEEKKEAMAKVAEATFLGKVMAHSLVAELREISKEASVETETDSGEGEDKEAGVKDRLKNLAGTVGLGAGLTGQKAKYEIGRAAKKLDEVGAAGARRVARIGEGGKTVPVGHSKVRDAVAQHGHRAAAGVAVAGGSGAAAHKALSKGKKKESSAIDELALEAAVEKAAEAGFDGEEAAQRVVAVHTLGLLGESEKVASAIDHEAAIDVRALEYLEAAGYPVTWNE